MTVRRIFGANDHLRGRPIGAAGRRGVNEMAESETGVSGGGTGERIPFMQRLLDNHFLLLFLGVVIPAVFYILWGVMEITQIPVGDY